MWCISIFGPKTLPYLYGKIFVELIFAMHFTVLYRTLHYIFKILYFALLCSIVQYSKCSYCCTGTLYRGFFLLLSLSTFTTGLSQYLFHVFRSPVHAGDQGQTGIKDRPNSLRSPCGVNFGFCRSGAIATPRPHSTHGRFGKALQGIPSSSIRLRNAQSTLPHPTSGFFVTESEGSYRVCRCLTGFTQALPFLESVAVIAICKTIANTENFFSPFLFLLTVSSMRDFSSIPFGGMGIGQVLAGLCLIRGPN